jgi:outer membrane protein TolC
VLQAPALARTILDPSLVETDPRFGVEAALSAFDAQLAMTGLFEKNDRAVNNNILTGSTPGSPNRNKFLQDLNVFQTQIAKQSATGAEFAFRHNATYDANNANANLFPSAWDTNLEAEFRQPLGQGRGVNFNRIAGPQATPGATNGVVIARINTDISVADFELGLRNLVNNVETAYWELYYGYRELDVKKQARDRALTSWRTISTQVKSGLASENQEARAREQYYRFEENVQNALSGRLALVSAGNNGLAVGFSNTAGGIYVAERRLRLLMGLPANDGKLICPSQDPPLARVVFDWDEVSREALVSRAELARQRILVNRRDLELVAARNFLLPQLDAFGLYRFRGFGHDLISANRDGKPEFDNAFMELTSGEYQEWQLGFELRLPVGFRQAHVGVRNAQLQLARAKAVLEEQERIIVNDLSNAMAELDRSYLVAQTVLNRRLAAEKELAILEKRQRDGQPVDVNLILDAQIRKADADSSYYRALVEYAIAVKNVHFAKGTLMEYNGIFLADGPWPESYAGQDPSSAKPAAQAAIVNEKPPETPVGGTAADQAIRGPDDEAKRVHFLSQDQQERGQFTEAAAFRRDPSNRLPAVRSAPLSGAASSAAAGVKRLPPVSPR